MTVVMYLLLTHHPTTTFDRTDRAQTVNKQCKVQQSQTETKQVSLSCQADQLGDQTANDR